MNGRVSGFRWQKRQQPFEMASAIHGLLEAEGCVVANGVLELRPNRKTYDADYALIRLPLTGEGNEVWVDGFGYCDDLGGFHQVWKAAEAKNRFVLPEALKQKLQEHHDVQRKACSRSGRDGQRILEAAKARLAEGFTGRGQSQELLFAAQQIARFVEGQSSVEGLRNRCQGLLMQAPSFSDFCGHQHQIQSGRYWGTAELRRLLEMPVGGYHGTSWEQANHFRATDAVARAREAIDQAERQEYVFSSTKAAILVLREYGAPSYSWWTRARQRELLLELRQRLLRSEKPGQANQETDHNDNGR